jgi:hypothetical protein
VAGTVEDTMKIIAMLLLAVGLGLGGLGFGASSASAMPMNGLVPAPLAQTDAGSGVENVRWICGPYGGCRWVPGWGYWRRPYWRPYYGYYRPWWWRRRYYYYW